MNRASGKAAIGRGAMGFASQGMSAAGNMALAIAVARGSTPEQFGAWAAAYVVYIVTLTMVRAAVCTPMLIGTRAGARPSERAEVAGGIGSAIVLGLVGALVVCVFALFVEDSHRGLFYAMALVLPALMTQDAQRHVFFMRGSPGKAALLDGVWLAFQGISFSVLITRELESGVAATLCWGSAGLVAVGVGFLLIRILPDPRSIPDFAKRHAWSSKRTLIDALLLALSNQIVPAVVAAFAGLSAAGALRAGQTLFGPVATLAMGLTPIATVELRRRLAATGRKEFVAPMALWSAVVGGGALLYSTAILLLPSEVGRTLFKESWEGARYVLLPLAVQAVLRPGITGPPLILRAYQHLNEMVVMRAVIFLPGLVAPAFGAYRNGASGAAWALAFYSAVVTLVGLGVLMRVANQRVSSKHRETRTEDNHEDVGELG